MNILFLTDNFPPEVNAPASRTFEHAREWVRCGHSVTVITGAPNFPAGRVFEGYRNRPIRRETMDGIEIVRVWTYVAANEGFLKRTLDHASYMASAAIAGTVVGRRPDVVVATSPQLFSALAGWLVSRARRAPFVFELRDLWPESIRAVGAIRDGFLYRRVEALEMFLYRRADAIVAVTRSFRDRLIERGIDGAKISVVTNGADLGRFAPMPKDDALASELGLAGRFVAGYVGTHGMAHGLETLLEAAALMRERGRDDFRLVMLGDGAERGRLRERARLMRLDNVVFLESVPKAEVARYWSLLDVSIIHLRRTELFKTVIPSKLFECMAMGIPVVHGVDGESAQIVESAGCGIAVEPGNAGALAEALTALADAPERRRRLGENGLRAARGFDRARLAAQMLEILKARSAASPGR